MNNEQRKASTKMHRSFFDKARKAIDDGYYLEAIMFEYAAIEGRLEVICGRLGCPCNRALDSDARKKIKISQRIECLKKLYKKHPACRTMLEVYDKEFWKQLKDWTIVRNRYVHGLYKDPSLYWGRLNNRRELAKIGLEIARILYNEAKRLGRVQKNHPGKLDYSGNLCSKGCCFEKKD